MNAIPMEEGGHVNKYVPTPLDHSPAAVWLDTPCLEMPAMVMSNHTLSLSASCIHGPWSPTPVYY